MAIFHELDSDRREERGLSFSTALEFYEESRKVYCKNTCACPGIAASGGEERTTIEYNRIDPNASGLFNILISTQGVLRDTEQLFACVSFSELKLGWVGRISSWYKRNVH